MSTLALAGTEYAIVRTGTTGWAQHLLWTESGQALGGCADRSEDWREPINEDGPLCLTCTAVAHVIALARASARKER